MEVGDTLIAKERCGFPDGTTKGKEYVVSRIEKLPNNRLFFYVMNDEGKETMPISTVFEIKR